MNEYLHITEIINLRDEYKTMYYLFIELLKAPHFKYLVFMLKFSIFHIKIVVLYSIKREDSDLVLFQVFGYFMYVLVI